ncbi:ABC transporter ATP-binding protein [Fodinicurvata sp. EGI_FJ10296]|uniref:ABC transporter ATP-binding protein n=1 Tax=Fodinicurvata sp. EGI_FJ10296 TaxID=3231908 RepID=UPI0034520ABA
MNDEAGAIVRLDGITKSFGATKAVADLDLSIAEGQFVTLLGPSGCGKSTTLRLLGGFEVPDRGRILLDGSDVTRVPPNKRNVNMVFQDYALFPHMTVHRNVAFGLELQGRNRRQIDERVESLLDFLQLSEHARRMPDQLSGGQRQRAALARALAPDPKVLLLDEPLGALDAKLRSQVQVELKSIQRSTGKTFIFVTHDQEEALTMSDRIVVMNEGRIEQDGTPEELYHQPLSRFVAGFIGETNFIDCTVKGRDGDEIVLDWHGAELRATGAGRTVAVGTRVEAAVRPENILCQSYRPDTAPSTTNVLEGRVIRRVFKGNRTTIDIALPDRGDATLQASVDPFILDRIDDDRIWIGWNAARMAVLKT